MKEFAKKFYKSKQWQQCRKLYIAERTLIDGGVCEICHEKTGYIVHHKIMLTAENITDPNIALNKNNLQYVCKDCHDRIDGHFIRNVVQQYCKFDESGQPIPPIA